MRKIAIALVISILFQAIFISKSDFAENDSINKLGSMNDIELSKLTDDEIFLIITSSKDYPERIGAKLRYNGSTSSDYDISKMVNLNILSYRKYRKIVYGLPFDQQKNYPGTVLYGSESKYVGFNNQGNAVTNDKYPGDSEGDEPPDKDWIEAPKKYKESWELFNRSSLEDDEKISMYDHMLNSDTINDDAVGTYTLAEILKKKWAI